MHNVCPKHPPNTCPSERNGGWIYGAGLSPKWRSPLGYECSYDEDGNLKPDVDANYTYNYGPDPYTLKHIIYDVIAHFLFGGADAYYTHLTTVVECEVAGSPARYIHAAPGM